MEVVSPITFAHPNGGSKRRFGCADSTTSPAAFAPSSPHHHSADENMDDGSGGYGFHATKRRRKNNQECAGSALLQKENNWSISPFLSGTAALPQPGCQTPISGENNKRSRTTSPQHSFGSSGLQHHRSNPAHQKIQELQQVVQQQAAEIDHLKSENGSLQTQNQKVEHENRILKRAVTIQQDRQHQVHAELEGARAFKEQAEDRMRRLEQMILTLQYQLQAQGSSAGNDFMAFRPPDVY
mmetsp:Transcript_3661/g.5564  ORF Transcript_3661/g.5564 Transcript_3661/m.5564 type:complete len:240 (+) Transcript_3661:559-1278(+)|eukprot:CAMPEP_0201736590 /NCGR_PEP_ID=MMETSP0593-20130828/40172_1 /ASSEMBLY_ACC=CAM_ASM_000672 /TAXON_ID=267983 /ORGANISM="Skeletonema japonicum, Strain CCMP2506" /LENGTH=239 /DNA_ID=CAMNT_0048230385 /DNA_START=188 /DNA_END=907 /DNA_ORIENTATION=+